MHWLILFSPIINATFNLLISHRCSTIIRNIFRSSWVLIPFIASTILWINFSNLDQMSVVIADFSWVNAHNTSIPIHLVLDQSSAIIQLIMTFICFFCYTYFTWSTNLSTRIFIIFDFMTILLFMISLSHNIPTAVIGIHGLLASFVVIKNYLQRENFKRHKGIISKLLYSPIRLFSGIINFISKLVMAISGIISFSMTGSIQRHLTVIILGLFIMLLLTLFVK